MPLMVFVNPKSGGQLGQTLISMLFTYDNEHVLIIIQPTSEGFWELLRSSTWERLAQNQGMTPSKLLFIA